MAICVHKAEDMELEGLDREMERKKVNANFNWTCEERLVQAPSAHE